MNYSAVGWRFQQRISSCNAQYIITVYGRTVAYRRYSVSVTGAGVLTIIQPRILSTIDQNWLYITETAGKLPRFLYLTAGTETYAF